MKKKVMIQIEGLDFLSNIIENMPGSKKSKRDLLLRTISEQVCKKCRKNINTPSIEMSVEGKYTVTAYIKTIVVTESYRGGKKSVKRIKICLFRLKFSKMINPSRVEFLYEEPTESIIDKYIIPGCSGVKIIGFANEDWQQFIPESIVKEELIKTFIKELQWTKTLPERRSRRK